MTVTLVKNDPDANWFQDHKDRQAHIRNPIRILESDKKNHVVRYTTECEAEFHTLGWHPKDRRRILLWKVPVDNVFYDARNPQILKIPFLLNSDETVEDRDDILLPIIHEIMLGKAN